MNESHPNCLRKKNVVIQLRMGCMAERVVRFSVHFLQMQLHRIPQDEPCFNAHIALKDHLVFPSPVLLISLPDWLPFVIGS